MKVIKTFILILLVICNFAATVFADEIDNFQIIVNRKKSTAKILRIEITVPDSTKINEVKYSFNRWGDIAENFEFNSIDFLQYNSNSYFIEIDKKLYKHKQDYLLQFDITTNHYNFTELESKFTRPRSHYYKIRIDSNFKIKELSKTRMANLEKRIPASENKIQNKINSSLASEKATIEEAPATNQTEAAKIENHPLMVRKYYHRQIEFHHLKIEL